MKYVLILEDFKDTRDWLHNIVKQCLPNAEVTLASTVENALDASENTRFNLALVDLSLPDGNGLDVVKHLHAQDHDTYIVICSIYDDDQRVIECLSHGADGYLLKEDSEEDFLRRLKGILKGEPPLTPTIARKIVRHFRRKETIQVQANLQQQNEDSTNYLDQLERHPGQHATQHTSSNKHLSKREKEVLTLIAKGLSRSDVASLLDVSVHTVAGHIKKIYAKLNISSRSEAVIEASKQGLINL